MREERTQQFRESIVLAIQQSGLDDRLDYSDVEAMLHMAFGQGNRAVPWWQKFKTVILGLEGGIEPVLLSVAGLALAYVRDRDAREDRELTACFLDAMHEWRDDYRRQFDPGGEVNGERYYLPGHPTTFGEIEAGFTESVGELADYKLEEILIRQGAQLDDEPADRETDGTFEDERLQRMWDLGDETDRAFLEHLAAGVSMSQASLLVGRAKNWGTRRLGRLKEMVGA